MAGNVGVPWNGLVSVQEISSGGESQALHFDGKKYMEVVAAEDFAATIEAITYPDEFEEFTGFDGEADNQPFQRFFGLSYRTEVEGGHHIHLVYNAIATPSDRSLESIDGDASMSTFSWDILAKPEETPEARPTAHLIIDTTWAYPGAVEDIEGYLYGVDEADATLPSLVSVLGAFTPYNTFTVVDNGDGTWTATGPDDMIEYLDPTTFRITSPSANGVSPVAYTLSSI